MVFKIPPWKSPRWVDFVSKMSSDQRVCGGGAVGKVIGVGGGSSCGRVRDRCQSATIVVGVGDRVPILIGGRQDTTRVGDRPLTSSVTVMPCHLPQRGRLRHSTVPCLTCLGISITQSSCYTFICFLSRQGDKRTVPLSLMS